MAKNEALKEDIQTFSTKQNAIENSNEDLQTKTIFVGAICPNCGARLEGRKCKLFCPTRGCGYLVTCSEW